MSANGVLDVGWYVVLAGLGSLLITLIAWAIEEFTDLDLTRLYRVFGLLALALVVIGFALVIFGAWRA